MVTREERLSGIGMTSTRTRARMVERLRADGIRDEVVLAAMNAVPRHIFVDEALAIRAYEDTPLPIGSGQTISQPWVVARMTELAQLAAEVYTVERIATLVTKARRNLQALKAKNVRLMHGDGTADLGEELQCDAIVVTAGTTHVPPGLLKYLAPGGRMVLPLTQHGEHGDGVQRLTVIERGASGCREQTFDAVRFVPLLPGIA